MVTKSVDYFLVFSDKQQHAMHAHALLFFLSLLLVRTETSMHTCKKKYPQTTSLPIHKSKLKKPIHFSFDSMISIVLCCLKVLSYLIHWIQCYIPPYISVPCPLRLQIKLTKYFPLSLILLIILKTTLSVWFSNFLFEHWWK